MPRTPLVVLSLLTVLLCLITAAPAREIVYRYDLSTDPGWTTDGKWEWGATDSCCVSTAHSPGGMYGHDLNDGYVAPMDAESLTTTPIDCTGLTGVRLGCWMVCGIGQDGQASVQVSNDGATWTTVWETGSRTAVGWEFFDFDISAVADGQPTVYVRWVVGPVASWGSGLGLDVDDAMITTEAGTPLLGVLVWTPRTPDMTATTNLSALLTTQLPEAWVTTSSTNDMGELQALLATTQVLVVPTPEWGASGSASAPLSAPVPGTEDPCARTCGQNAAGVLADFVARGGTVITCGETLGTAGFTHATGLMGLSWSSGTLSNSPLTVTAPGDPLLAGLSSPVLSQYMTNGYSVGSRATSVLMDSTRNTVAATRRIGLGGLVVLGYTFDEYDDNAARLLANATGFPRSGRKVLVYDTSSRHTATEALARLYQPYTTAGPADFADLLGSQRWDLVLVDNPAQESGSWEALSSYLANDGRVALSTGDLQLHPELWAELGLSNVDPVGAIPPMHWTPEGALRVAGLPDLVNWDNDWPVSGFRLAPGELADFSLADYEAVPTSSCQAALVSGNGGRSLVHGFLWDERDQDANGNGIDDTVELVMLEARHLLRLPRADFAASPKSGSLPLTVNFADRSDGTPTSWEWQFGDGATSTQQDPVHVYTDPGVYTVTLTVSNDDGTDQSMKEDFIVAAVPTPEVDFSADVTSGQAPLTVAFSDLSTNGPTTWAWDFGDGSTSTEQSPTHTYVAGGTFTVSLVATNPAGPGSATKAGYIVVTPPALRADFAADVTSGDLPLAVNFADLSANGPTAWSWTFGDGGTSTTQSPSHVYTAPGQYTVTLAISRGADVAAETKEHYITVGRPAPEARFSASPTFGAAPLPVQFTDESTGGPTSWSWDFGDGATSTEQSPSHTYTRPGEYTVTLTAGNAGGPDTAVRTRCVTTWFVDVPYGYWSYREIVACVQAGIVRGYDDGYRPDAVVTRDQMAVFLARALAGGEGHVPTGPAVATFPDVPALHWAFGAVEYCVAHGIVAGYDDGLYRPDDPVNRAQMAVFSARAAAGGEAGVAGYTPPAEPSFSDVALDFWAFRHIEYCRANAIVQGYPDGTYRPDALVKRDQMAVYLSRIFHLMGG